MYLMTSPHSHQSGLYWLPKMYICNEIGLPSEGASKALAWLSEENFCKYDEATEWVWVCEMAAWQIGTGLSAIDKRCKGVQQYLTTLPELPFLSAYIDRYADDFHLKPLSSRGIEGASKGAPSEQSGTEKNRADRATRIPDDFSLTQERRIVAEAERLPAERTFQKFCDYWRAIGGQKARKIDWDATWRNWCRTEADRGGAKVNGANKSPYKGAI